MAQSPSHKFGQIIGEMLEAMIQAPLQRIAEKYALYLDYEHRRPARNNRRKVAWKDRKGNVHDLDYVLENDGSESQFGTPRAFIETAWRRYTKHSRNKAQEIQGAIVPLAETYSEFYPFLGVVLAGVFTNGSLTQLQSHEFSILYYPYETICKAFAAVGIDAAFDEQTPDAELQKKVDAYDALPQPQKDKIVSTLAGLRKADLRTFISELEGSLNRTIIKISIVGLHGQSAEVKSISDAVALVEGYDEFGSVDGFVRYEINVAYSNGDEIRANLKDKRTALEFLRGLH